MKITNLIESLCLMFCIWSLRLAFLAAGCWMIYNGWYGCGLTTVIVTVLIVGKYQNDDEDKEGEHKKKSSKDKYFSDSRPLFLVSDLDPCFYETDEMGVDEVGDFFYIMGGEGGGKRGIVCGMTGKVCNGDCFKRNALYLSYEGRPLFFCRNFYTVFKGRRYVEKFIFSDEVKP